MTQEIIPVKQATLIKRYKRFLADVTLQDGQETTLHVANTGAMTGCADPNDSVWYSTSDNPKRKYPFSWEFTQKPNGDLICVNTHKANEFVEQALLQQNIHEFTVLKSVVREVKYGAENSKIDFLLTDKDNQQTYVEVKSVTLLGDDKGQGYFPDAVTTRGQKHLRELITMVESGHNACLLFFVMHSGIERVAPAEHIDPKYAELLRLAKQKGVQILAYKAVFSAADEGIKLVDFIPIKVST